MGAYVRTIRLFVGWFVAYAQARQGPTPVLAKTPGPATPVFVPIVTEAIPSTAAPRLASAAAVIEHQAGGRRSASGLRHG